MTVEGDFKDNGWLHFYQMQNYNDQRVVPKIISKTKGIRVYDSDGHEYIDALSGSYCVNVGYGREEVIEAIADAGKKISYTSPFSSTNPYCIKLSQKLSELAEPVLGAGARVFFVNSGSEAVDGAIKLVRAYHERLGEGHKDVILTKNFSYHGTTYGALTASSAPDLHREFGPVVPGIFKIPTSSCHICEFNLKPETCSINCISPLMPIITENSNNLAGFIIEVFDTATGAGQTRQEYFERISLLKEKHNALLVVDEVITGFGRTGTWFASEHFTIKPDILICAKGLTSGYESLGAIIVKKQVADVFLGADELMFSHGSTFGGRPTAAAAALKVIEIIEKENLLYNASQMERVMFEKINKKLSSYDIIGDIRGKGLLFGIDLRLPQTVNVDKFLLDLRQRILLNGVINCLYFTKSDNFIDIAPPLIICEEEIEEMIEKISKAVCWAQEKLS